MKGDLRQIIVFTRYPEEGKTKTRLIPLLGGDGAANLQRRMTEHTLNQARRFAERYPVSIQVWYEGGDKSLMCGWLGNELNYTRQSAGFPF